MQVARGQRGTAPGARPGHGDPRAGAQPGPRHSPDPAGPGARTAAIPTAGSAAGTAARNGLCPPGRVTGAGIWFCPLLGAEAQPPALSWGGAGISDPSSTIWDERGAAPSPPRAPSQKGSGISAPSSATWESLSPSRGPCWCLPADWSCHYRLNKSLARVLLNPCLRGNKPVKVEESRAFPRLSHAAGALAHIPGLPALRKCLDSLEQITHL